ncbi:MAG TPA: lipid-binding protein [Puia sp.]|nr:lipid-binding protein [Puia sp.]
MKKIFFLFFFTAVIVVSSCKKAFDPGTTKAHKIANGWYVTLTYNGDDIYSLGTFFLDTYNTAASGDSIWVDDLQHSWIFKCKAAASFSSQTFTATHASNNYNGDSSYVNILNGKILAGAGTTKGGNKSDSIYMQINFSDDPDKLNYVISGTARTGFIEDDYKDQ